MDHKTCPLLASNHVLHPQADEMYINYIIYKRPDGGQRMKTTRRFECRDKKPEQVTQGISSKVADSNMQGGSSQGERFGQGQSSVHERTGPKVLQQTPPRSICKKHQAGRGSELMGVYEKR